MTKLLRYWYWYWVILGCFTDFGIGIVEILFPKKTLHARALEKIPPHEIEVSEGVSIFIKKKKINILLPYRIKDSQISFKLSFLRVGPWVTQLP